MSMTVFVKNTTLAWTNGPNFVRATETRHGTMCGKRHRPSRNKTGPPTCCLEGEEVAQSGSTEAVFDPPSPISRHVKWKMARTKKIGQMSSTATKEIADKIASQVSFVPHGHQDVLTAAIGRPEHGGRVRAAGAGVTIKHFFGPAKKTYCNSSFIDPKELEQLTQQIRD
ncbi:hypothetical protein GmHk_12G035254 [Glycine max]|nr:hypothetical protein GmHk_12G035254 [Glycine max]